MTVGSGTIPVRMPRVNDKRVDEETGERQRFSSKILPAYARRSPKVGEVIPILYLRGLSTGDFKPALESLLGQDAAGLSPTTIARMSKEWEDEHAQFSRRQLGFSRYAYLFMDGIHVRVRLGEDAKVCLLIVIGVREDGVKELLAVEDGYRESTESWAGVFRDLKRRGLNDPKLVMGDGAWARGPRSVTSIRAPLSSVAGSTLPGTSSTAFPSACTPKPRACCARLSRRLLARTPGSLSRCSGRNTAPGTPRRWPSSIATGFR